MLILLYTLAHNPILSELRSVITVIGLPCGTGVSLQLLLIFHEAGPASVIT